MLCCEGVSGFGVLRIRETYERSGRETASAFETTILLELGVKVRHGWPRVSWCSNLWEIVGGGNRLGHRDVLE